MAIPRRPNRWRRYDKLRRLPDGLLVVGDANCSFNPIYGQGMTVAAMDALVLRDCLRGGAPDLSRRYFAAAAKGIGVAWQMAVGSDLALPEVESARPISRCGYQTPTAIGCYLPQSPIVESPNSSGGCSISSSFRSTCYAPRSWCASSSLSSAARSAFARRMRVCEWPVTTSS